MRSEKADILQASVNQYRVQSGHILAALPVPRQRVLQARAEGRGRFLKESLVIFHFPFSISLKRLVRCALLKMENEKWKMENDQ